MQTALRLTTIVLPGSRIEVTSPELREGGKVELIILFPDSEQANTPGLTGRYPAILEAEYNALIQKKLARMLTSEEALRLEAVRDEISAIDRNHPDIRAIQAQTLSAELAQIRAELEALPLAESANPVFFSAANPPRLYRDYGEYRSLLPISRKM